MGSRNGQSVYDAIMNGWRRSVLEVGGTGCRGVSIPADFAEEHEIEVGDDVAVKKSDDEEGVLELHFE